MIINGRQIDETEILDIGHDSSIFTVSDLIEYVLDNPAAFRSTEKPAVQDLKWANGWGSKTPEIVLICRELEHKVSDTRDQTYGHIHTIRCNKCGYFYHYDSS